MERVEIGRYMVSDPGIYQGQLTFRGTRITVRQVLSMVARGMDWDKIVWESYGSISREAIGEAVEMAAQTLLEQQPERLAA